MRASKNEKSKQRQAKAKLEGATVTIDLGSASYFPKTVLDAPARKSSRSRMQLQPSGVSHVHLNAFTSAALHQAGYRGTSTQLIITRQNSRKQYACLLAYLRPLACNHACGAPPHHSSYYCPQGRSGVPRFVGQTQVPRKVLAARDIKGSTTYLLGQQRYIRPCSLLIYLKFPSRGHNIDWRDPGPPFAKPGLLCG